jgi:hypothetical protein
MLLRWGVPLLRQVCFRRRRMMLLLILLLMLLVVLRPPAPVPSSELQQLHTINGTTQHTTA